ncbi:ribonuclease HI [bacterium]|nr:ribonuclease HI [bacterium]
MSKTAATHLPEGILHIFTDGACTGNPGPAGCGAVLMYNGRKKEIARFIGDATNNIAELMAVKIALEAVKDRTAPVVVNLDSEYVLGLLTLDWKVRANKELVTELRALAAAFPDLVFRKVPAHASVALNERADHLARMAIRKARTCA